MAARTTTRAETRRDRARGVHGSTLVRSISARLALVLVATVAMSALVVEPAHAHPLGNFSVNHYDELVFSPDGLEVLAVVDIAEIPTRQDRPDIDVDGDGVMGSGELATAAEDRCVQVADALVTTVDGTRTALAVTMSGMVAEPGAAGLETLRLTCRMTADVALDDGTVVEFEDGYRDDRVGWHEIVVVEDGLGVESSLPATSVSNRLNDYPEDLLSSPLDVRAASVTVVGGAGGAAGPADDLADTGDPFSRVVAAGDRLLEDTIGRDELTPVVGGLAILLAMVLGAGHAVLPGHGKTVMAAYLAGRRGTRTDAFIVGGTVTLTHTAGVLLLGLLLTVGTAVAGEVILQRLGLVSGLLIAGIGVGLVRDALRGRRRRRARAVASSGAGMGEPLFAAVGAGDATSAGVAVRRAGDDGPGHSPAHDHAHDGHDHAAHDHDDHDGHDHAAHDHDDHDGHDHDGHDDDGHADDGHDHGGHGHVHGRGFGHHHHEPLDDDPRFTRRGLVGMAVAGGLVPSPSALVVLLGSIALGRTLFGTTLVLAYGVGMAGTLTAVGLLLVRIRSRLDRRGGSGRFAGVFGRLAAILPLATACLVLVVGLGLVARALLVGA